MARGCWALLIALEACAPVTRVRRALAPESFVTPESPVGALAVVAVKPGWHDVPVAPYAPDIAYVRDGVVWMRPVELTDRGTITISPLRPDVTLGLYSRHVGLVPRDFQRILDRSGTLPGELETAIRFEPTGALGASAYTVAVADLQNVYSDDALEDGDLLMLEVRAVGETSERYLFQTFDFGWRTRAGAGVLLRVPTPLFDEGRGSLTPALTASMAFGYRPRTRGSAVAFLTEQFALVGSVGVGSTVLEVDGIDNQLQTAFNAALVGGGVDVFQMFSVQVLGNASAPFRDDVESGWALAVGFDAVQAARFADDLGTRLLRENPMREERASRADRPLPPAPAQR